MFVRRLKIASSPFDGARLADALQKDGTVKPEIWMDQAGRKWQDASPQPMSRKTFASQPLQPAPPGAEGGHFVAPRRQQNLDCVKPPLTYEAISAAASPQHRLPPPQEVNAKPLRCEAPLSIHLMTHDVSRYHVDVGLMPCPGPYCRPPGHRRVAWPPVAILAALLLRFNASNAFAPAPSHTGRLERLRPAAVPAVVEESISDPFVSGKPGRAGGGGDGGPTPQERVQVIVYRAALATTALCWCLTYTLDFFMTSGISAAALAVADVSASIAAIAAPTGSRLVAGVLLRLLGSATLALAALGLSAPGMVGAAAGPCCLVLVCAREIFWFGWSYKVDAIFSLILFAGVAGLRFAASSVSTSEALAPETPVFESWDQMPTVPTLFDVRPVGPPVGGGGAMLALEEKTRNVVLLMPQLILEGKADELVSKFEEAYLEVKARKEVYLAEEAESYFHYLQPKAREAAVLAASRGLSQVLVLEHLDGDVVERSLAMKEGLEEMYGKGSFYMSLDKWECQRDLVE
eukprot:s3681_g8.t1